jgi:hypothetical protein
MKINTPSVKYESNFRNQNNSLQMMQLRIQKASQRMKVGKKVTLVIRYWVGMSLRLKKRNEKG